MEIARHVLNFLFTLLEVILIFNLLIVVHETGTLPRRPLAGFGDREVRHLVWQTALEEGRSMACSTAWVRCRSAGSWRCLRWHRWTWRRARRSPTAPTTRRFRPWTRSSWPWPGRCFRSGLALLFRGVGLDRRQSGQRAGDEPAPSVTSCPDSPASRARMHHAGRAERFALRAT